MMLLSGENALFTQMNKVDFDSLKEFCNKYEASEENDDRDEDFYEDYSKLFSPLIEIDRWIIYGQDLKSKMNNPEELDNLIERWENADLEDTIKIFSPLREHPEWETIQRVLKIFDKEGGKNDQEN